MNKDGKFWAWWWNVKSELINITRVRNKGKETKKEKIWGPNKNRTHGLSPNIGQVLYPLSYKNSWRARSFNWVHVWQASNTCIGTLFFDKYPISFNLVVRAKGHKQREPKVGSQTFSPFLFLVSCHFMYYEAEFKNSLEWTLMVQVNKLIFGKVYRGTSLLQVWIPWHPDWNIKHCFGPMYRYW